MIELSKAIYSKISGSSFSTAIGGRFFEDEAPEGADYPYAIYKIVSSTPDYVFAGKHEDYLVQFSMFSTASGSTEIKTITEYLKTLFDECSLTITGLTLLYMGWQNTVGPSTEEHTTPAGTQKAWACHSDYRVSVKL